MNKSRRLAKRITLQAIQQTLGVQEEKEKNEKTRALEGKQTDTSSQKIAHRVSNAMTSSHRLYVRTCKFNQCPTLS